MNHLLSAIFQSISSLVALIDKTVLLKSVNNKLLRLFLLIPCGIIWETWEIVSIKLSALNNELDIVGLFNKKSAIFFSDSKCFLVEQSISLLNTRIQPVTVDLHRSSDDIYFTIISRPSVLPDWVY